MKTLILGIGNTIRGDDGIGIAVIRRLRERNLPGDVHLSESQRGGIDLLDLMKGYGRTIIIDSIKTKGGKPGDIYRMLAEDLKNAEKPHTSHGLGLMNIMDLGTYTEQSMPEEVVIYAIEIDKIDDFCENITDSVTQSIPEVIESILKEVE